MEKKKKQSRHPVTWKQTNQNSKPTNPRIKQITHKQIIKSNHIHPLPAGQGRQQAQSPQCSP